MENQRQIGREYEKMAAEYLEASGFQILSCNYRCRYGEIDLIAKDGEVLVFCEVKYRSDTNQEAANNLQMCGSILAGVWDRRNALSLRCDQHFRTGDLSDPGCILRTRINMVHRCLTKNKGRREYWRIVGRKQTKETYWK